MTELNRQNAEQLRRVAEENTKSKQNNIKSVQSKIHSSNPFQDENYNIRNIKKSNAHKFTEQYLDADTALKEFFRYFKDIVINKFSMTYTNYKRPEIATKYMTKHYRENNDNFLVL